MRYPEKKKGCLAYEEIDAQLVATLKILEYMNNAKLKALWDLNAGGSPS